MVTAGYDLGGAHLKVALAEGGIITAVGQIACPLWEGVERLDEALRAARPLIERAQHHAVTMTGEMCELFPDRKTGVLALIDRLEVLLGDDLRVYMGPRGFGSVPEARVDPAAVASMNFLATTECAAHHIHDALVVDMGSTTTDVIAVVGGRAVPHGLTDGSRLATGELIYSGLTRTDVSVVTGDARLQNRTQRLAAGNFANMADVRRILGVLPDEVDQHRTADGRGTTLEESLARFARCFGRDRADATFEEWREAAGEIADRQMHEILVAIGEVVAATPLPDDAPIIAAGIGAEAIAELASELNRTCRTFGDLIGAAEDCRDWATRCAPAASVALLAQRDGDG
jgi:(4-(4-[2-(gamma-L-glutamylamino)ethyl]phenoxymethyl)furan-2-yl)methanamine synthase